MLRTSAPLIGALGGRKRASRCFTKECNQSLVEALKVYFNELRYLFHCRLGHSRDGAILGRVAERSYSNAGADADNLPPHRQGSTASHWIRVQRPRLRPTSSCPVQSQWRCPEVQHLGHLKSSNGRATPGSKQADDLSELPEPRTNNPRSRTRRTRMGSINQIKVRKSSLPPNQPT